MLIKVLDTGLFDSNCYILGDSGEGVIIDPGSSEDKIMNAVNESGLSIKYIILTHGHLDHILSVDRIREITGAKVLIHKDEAEILSDPMLNCSGVVGMNMDFKEADRLLEDGDIIEFGNCRIEIIHTPGHTPGGISLKTGEGVFTGDTLFYMSVGRTDLGKGNFNDLVRSIKKRLMVLDDNTVIFPGHGQKTTVGFEKRNNPFIKQ